MEALRERIRRLTVLHKPEVFIFAECAAATRRMKHTLNRANLGAYYCPRSRSRRIRIFTRISKTALEDVFNSQRLTIRRLAAGPPPGILLAALHFQSLRNWSREDQILEATTVAQDIQRAEERLRHRRTVLVGDLNMNPFHPGMVGAQALNAVMTQALAKPGSRVVAGREYRFFYNPMWGCFGDHSPGPPGTFFREGSAPANHFWSVFDQVLLRPDLVGTLAQVEVLDSDGQETLLTVEGRPRKDDLSDHLPLLFRLNL